MTSWSDVSRSWLHKLIHKATPSHGNMSAVQLAVEAVQTFHVRFPGGSAGIRYVAGDTDVNAYNVNHIDPIMTNDIRNVNNPALTACIS